MFDLAVVETSAMLRMQLDLESRAMRFMLTSVLVCLALPVSAAKMAFLPAPNDSVLMVFGEIKKGDAAKFRSALASRAVSQVILDGPGGDYFESIEIAQDIYMHGLMTIAPGVIPCTRGEDQTCVRRHFQPAQHMPCTVCEAIRSAKKIPQTQYQSL